MRNIAIILTALFLASCATFRPDSSDTTYKDYNGRITVERPHYNKRTNVVGYAGMALSAAAGGYAAYKYGGDGIITYYNNGEKKHLKAADAALGALTGFTISYIVNNLIFKPNNSKYIYSEDEYKKWIKKAGLDDKYNFLESNGSNLSIIDKSYESNFKVRNDTDIEDFQKAFPNSSYLEDVLEKSIENVSRSKLFFLIKMYPNSKNINRMKKQYVESSPTLLDFYENYYAYPNVGVIDKSGIISTLLSKTNRNNLSNIISKFKDDSDINKLKYAYIDKSSNLNEFLEGKNLYKDISYDYNKKALSLLNDLKDLDVYTKLVNVDYLAKGKRKVDEILWSNAKKQNTKKSYRYYLNNSPQKLYISLATQKIKLIEQKERDSLEKERLAKIQKEREKREEYEKLWEQTVDYFNNKKVIGKSGYYEVDYKMGWGKTAKVKVEFVVTDVFGKVEKYNKTSLLNDISCEVSIRSWDYEGNMLVRALTSDSRVKYDMDKKIGKRITLKFEEMIIYGFNDKN